MAITNAQQYQQILQKEREEKAFGGLLGLDGRRAYVGGSYAETSPGSGKERGSYQGRDDSGGYGGNYSGGDGGADSSYVTPTQEANNAAAIAKGKAEKAAADKKAADKEKRKTVREKIAEYNKNYKKKQLNRYQRSKIDLLNKNLQELEPGLFYGDTEETYQDFIDRYAPSLTEFGPEGTKKYSQQFLDDVASGKRPPPKSTLDTGIPSIDFINNTINDVPITKEYLTDLYSGDKNSYTRARDFDIDSATSKEMMEEFEPNRFKLENNDGGGGGGGNQQQTDPCLGPNPPAYCNVGNDTEEEDATPSRNLGGLAPRFAGSIFDFTGLADGGRAGAMDGGRMMMMANQEEDDPTGGIMDLESGRQMYFLGKLVKKATRAVKKIVKSPVGKAALMYFGGNALMGAGGGKGLSSFFGKGSFNPLKALITKGPQTGMLGSSGLGKIFGNLGLAKEGALTLGGKLGLGFGIPMALDALGIGKEEEDGFDLDEYYKTQGIDIDAIRNNPNRILARRFMAEGGDAEPVAKETMPLIDMDGKEMDLREDGGFVPIGRMERADDVPARLSKNEFVFTADAVRNAGEGDIDKGAEVMYNMMKNLESGGDVSEESQGLDGAREMFKTSQRLEEVL